MEALRIEISRIVSSFDKVKDEMEIYIYCQQERSFKLSLNFFEKKILTELWILINKVSMSSKLNELLLSRPVLKSFNCLTQLNSIGATLFRPATLIPSLLKTILVIPLFFLNPLIHL